MSTRTRLAESVLEADRARREGYAAEDRGVHWMSCPYQEEWLRTAWLKGWHQSEKMRAPADS